MAPETMLLADATLLRAFEDGTLPPSNFHHREHVRVAWLYLKAVPPLTALARFAEGLRRFAAAQGAAGLYHETITWAYLLLIRERMELEGSGTTSQEFAERNPDLLAWKPSILDRYYRPETLGSELARRVFVMPDRWLTLEGGGTADHHSGHHPAVPGSPLNGPTTSFVIQPP